MSLVWSATSPWFEAQVVESRIPVEGPSTFDINLLSLAPLLQLDTQQRTRMQLAVGYLHVCIYIYI